VFPSDFISHFVDYLVVGTLVATGGIGLTTAQKLREL